MSSTASETCRGCGKDFDAPTIMGHRLIFYCPDCSDAAVAQEAATARAQAEESILRRAGATPRLLAQALENSDLAREVAAARAWIAAYDAGAKQNLWLSGEVGTGKTWIAWGIVRELSLAAVARYFDAEDPPGNGPGTPALLVNWRDLLEDIRRSFSGPESEGRGLYLHCQRVPVLALDDLGAERPTPWALEQLAGLVQARYDAMAPTIVTSNYYSDELEERLGGDSVAQRILTRLVEGCSSIRFEGTNRRRAA